MLLNRGLRRVAPPPLEFIGYAQAQSAAVSRQLTVTLPPYRPGDLCVILAYKAVNSGDFLTVPGFTLDAADVGTNLACIFKLMSRVMTSSDGATITLEYTGDSASTRAFRYVIVTFRGASSYAMAYTVDLSTNTPDPPSRSVPWGTTRETAVLYLALTRITGNSAIGAAPSGYTLIGSTATDATGYKIDRTSGPEDPGSWGAYASTSSWFTATYVMEGRY